MPRDKASGRRWDKANHELKLWFIVKSLCKKNGWAVPDRVQWVRQKKLLLHSPWVVCEICGTDKNGMRRHHLTLKTVSLSIDHDHMTGKIRGFLCDRCNQSLDYGTKYGDKMREYLAKYSSRQVTL